MRTRSGGSATRRRPPRPRRCLLGGPRNPACSRTSLTSLRFSCVVLDDQDALTGHGAPRPPGRRPRQSSVRSVRRCGVSSTPARPAPRPNCSRVTGLTRYSAAPSAMPRAPLVEDRDDHDRHPRRRRVPLDARQDLPPVDAREAGCPAPRPPAAPWCSRSNACSPVGTTLHPQSLVRQQDASSGPGRAGRPRRPAPQPDPASPSGIGARGARPGRRSESLKPNVLPRPASLSSHMRPPCRCTMRRLRVSPRPVPSCAPGARPPCWKDSKIRSRSPSGTPTPVSVTVIDDLSRRRDALDGDPATVRGELHRIGQQVQHDLPQPELVGLDLAHVIVDLDARRRAHGVAARSRTNRGSPPAAAARRRAERRGPSGRPRPSTGRGCR